MSPALNGNTALQHLERSNAVKVHNGIMFDFYPGLPCVCMVSNVSIGITQRKLSFYSEVIFFLPFCNLWIMSCQHDKFTTPSLTFCTGSEGVVKETMV